MLFGDTKIESRKKVLMEGSKREERKEDEGKKRKRATT